MPWLYWVDQRGQKKAGANLNPMTEEQRETFITGITERFPDDSDWHLDLYEDDGKIRRIK